eukprot:7184743-Prymnesium_polylepis.1
MATDLFPCLLLLSKLVPSPVSHDAELAAPDINAFVPLVQAAAALPSLHTRVVASRALVPLVPPSAVAPFLASLAAELEHAPAANRAHGLQLQMLALLGAALARSAGGGEAEGTARVELCATTLGALSPCAWLLLPSRNRCPVTRAAMAQMLAL